MEQMITNIWNLNALISGILVFLFLVFLTIFTILAIFLFPFRHKMNDLD